MPNPPPETLEVRDRRAWRRWLEKNHRSESVVWLVFYKRHTGITRVSYDEAVEEAICFGWIDSLVRRLDDDRYAQKFTPRKANSKWSTANRRRYVDLETRGLLAPAGLERPPTGRSGDAPRPFLSSIPRYIERRLKAAPDALRFFRQLAPSHQRAYIGWIDSAKREATKERRLVEAIDRLTAGKKLGMK